MTELLRLTKGTVQQTAWLPDGTRLAVATTVGVYLYNVMDGKELHYFATAPSPSIAISPDGKMLATGEGESVRIWNLATGDEQVILNIGGYSIHRIVFSPDLHTLAVECVMLPSQGEDLPETTAVQAWDITSGELLFSLLDRTWPVFSPDGYILAAFYDESIEFWDPAGGRFVDSLAGRQDFLFSPDGRFIAIQPVDHASSAYSPIELHALGSHQIQCKLETNDFIPGMSFSPDGKMFAASGPPGTAFVWDTSNCEQLYKITGHEGYTDFAFSPNGRILASYGRLDRTVRLWNADTGELKSTLTGFHGDLGSFSPDGRLLIEQRWYQGTVLVWNVDKRESVLTLDKHTVSSGAIAFEPGGGILASGHSYGTINLWSLNTTQIISTLNLSNGNAYVEDLAFSPDGRLLAAADTDAKIELWDAKSGQHLRTLAGHAPDKWVTRIAFSPDGNTLASYGTDQTVRLWDIQTGQARIVFVVVNNGGESGMGFSPNGQLIAVSTSNKFISFWNAGDGQLQFQLFAPGDSSYPNKLAFSQNGRIFAAAGYDTTWIWDMTTRSLLATLEQGNKNIGSIALNPEGTILAVSAWEGVDSFYRVELWDITSGKMVTSLPGHTDWIPSLTFSPDGCLLASASTDGTVRLWGIDR